MIVVVLVVCAVIVVTTTTYSYERAAVIGRPGGPHEPAWTRACRRHRARGNVSYILDCARVQGIVVYRQRRDPDGDADVHALVAVGSRLVIVKGRASSRLPGTGRRVDVAGTVTTGRFGLVVVDIRPRAAPRSRARRYREARGGTRGPVRLHPATGP